MNVNLCAYVCVKKQEAAAASSASWVEVVELYRWNSAHCERPSCTVGMETVLGNLVGGHLSRENVLSIDLLSQNSS